MDSGICMNVQINAGISDNVERHDDANTNKNDNNNNNDKIGVIHAGTTTKVYGIGGSVISSNRCNNNSGSVTDKGDDLDGSNNNNHNHNNIKDKNGSYSSDNNNNSSSSSQKEHLNALNQIKQEQEQKEKQQQLYQKTLLKQIKQLKKENEKSAKFENEINMKRARIEQLFRRNNIKYIDYEEEYAIYRENHFKEEEEEEGSDSDSDDKYCITCVMCGETPCSIIKDKEELDLCFAGADKLEDSTNIEKRCYCHRNYYLEMFGSLSGNCDRMELLPSCSKKAIKERYPEDNIFNKNVDYMEKNDDSSKYYTEWNTTCVMCGSIPCSLLREEIDIIFCFEIGDKYKGQYKEKRFRCYSAYVKRRFQKKLVREENINLPACFVYAVRNRYAYVVRNSNNNHNNDKSSINNDGTNTKISDIGGDDMSDCSMSSSRGSNNLGIVQVMDEGNNGVVMSISKGDNNSGLTIEGDGLHESNKNNNKMKNGSYSIDINNNSSSSNKSVSFPLLPSHHDENRISSSSQFGGIDDNIINSCVAMDGVDSLVQGGLSGDEQEEQEEEEEEQNGTKRNNNKRKRTQHYERQEQLNQVTHEHEQNEKQHLLYQKELLKQIKPLKKEKKEFGFKRRDLRKKIKRYEQLFKKNNLRYIAFDEEKVKICLEEKEGSFSDERVKYIDYEMENEKWDSYLKSRFENQEVSSDDSDENDEKNSTKN